MMRFIVAFMVAAACTALPPVASPSTSHESVTPTAAPSAPVRVFRVNDEQARYISTLVAFLDAYNSGNVEAALSLVGDGITGGDCDYSAAATFSFDGSKGRFAEWLRARAREHDRLVLEQVFNDNPDGGPVVGVVFAKRSSDAIAALGFPDGTRPGSVAKVVFSSDGRRITVWNGPAGDPQSRCRPS